MLNKDRITVLRILFEKYFAKQYKDIIEIYEKDIEGEEVLYISSAYFMCGESYLYTGQVKKACGVFITFLNSITEEDTITEIFSQFMRFFAKAKKHLSKEELIEYQNQILNNLKEGRSILKITYHTIAFLDVDIERDLEEDSRFYSIIKLDDEKYNRDIRQQIKKLEVRKDNFLLAGLFLAAQKIYEKSCKIEEPLARILVSVMEKNDLLREALPIAEKIADHTQESVAIRTMFRLCRKIGDYTSAEEFLNRYPQMIARQDFNIQYELVYYYENIKNFGGMRDSLKIIRDSARESLPINKTLYNFYIQFGMLDEARKIRNHIKKLEQKKYALLDNWEAVRETEQRESEEGVLEQFDRLITEQEQNRRLIALKDLIQGFSHELGQPVTNIRYMAQFYKKELECGRMRWEDVEEFLKGVLSQTERMGKLLQRFAPLTSSRSSETEFDLKERIEEKFQELELRLKREEIIYSISGESGWQIYGDPIKFDQVIYNLINNSIHAIKKAGKRGKIEVEIRNQNNQIQIRFRDNGEGIPKMIQNKIFEPFYTTKEPGEGEGLGLYLIWNIIKMFSGTISLEKRIKEGAEFVIELPEYKEHEI